MTHPPQRDDITGLVVAGGRGSRMGGVDKGLQLHRGMPLAQHALQRLAPQVGRVAVNANRNLAAYRAMGVEVWPDTLPGHPGPLAGWLAGLQRCTTPLLATVPCDVPSLPPDLVARLAAALTAAQAEIAIATSCEHGEPRPQPAFSVMQASLAADLAAHLADGGRAVHRWCASRRCVQVVFDDAGAFFNVNTAADLQQLGDC